MLSADAFTAMETDVTLDAAEFGATNILAEAAKKTKLRTSADKLGLSEIDAARQIRPGASVQKCREVSARRWHSTSCQGRVVVIYL